MDLGGSNWQRRDAGPPFQTILQFNASTGLLSVVLNVLFTYVAIQATGVPYLIANMLAIGAAALLNFMVLQLIVFRRRGGQAPRHGLG
jgi:putative flippase GtrA